MDNIDARQILGKGLATALFADMGANNDLIVRR
jgi:hypothetical protein